MTDREMLLYLLKKMKCKEAENLLEEQGFINNENTITLNMGDRNWIEYEFDNKNNLINYSFWYDE